MKKLINSMEDGYLTLLRCQDKKRHQILVHEKLNIFLICMKSNVTKPRSENKKKTWAPKLMSCGPGFTTTIKGLIPNSKSLNY